MLLILGFVAAFYTLGHLKWFEALVPLCFNQQVLYDLLRKRLPRETEECPLQDVQPGECSCFGMQSLETTPCLNWPQLLQFLLGVDPHLVQELFCLGSDIDEMGKSPRP